MAKQARLNPQGLSRRSPELMAAILPDNGDIAVSQDLGAAEPTVTAHFSDDFHYRMACFDMVGKAPYYKGSVLIISDIYLMCMSVSPVGKGPLLDAFNMKWPAGSFCDQWLTDDEVIKKHFKSLRHLHKACALGFGYGMRPRKAVKTLYEQGFSISEADATAFYRAYWHLFSGVKAFSDRMARRCARDGYLINPFHFRGTPDPIRAYNWFIQSSVSGIVHVLTAKLMAAAPYAKYQACIHDELVTSVPKDRIEDFRIDSDRAVQSLNDDINWSLPIRVGFAQGVSWYEAK